MKKFLIFSTLYLFLISNTAVADTETENLALEPFGANVYLFDPSMPSSTINNTVKTIYNQMQWNEFGDQRYALLFMPGQYGSTDNVDVPVGYYTQVLGLGETPNETVIKGAVRTQDRPPSDPNKPQEGPGALTNFWRGAENLAIIPTLGSMSYASVPKDQNVWAVSQASPLRRIRILNGSLRLYDMGWSSGGYLADSRIDKTIYSGTQQQWLTRNTQFANWNGSNWNIVFSGALGTIPTGTWPNPAYSVIAKTPVIREKPYLFFDKTANAFAVKVRTLRRNVAGTDWHIDGTILPLSSFYIAKPGVSAAEINAALAQKKHLFLTPGVYHLSDTINVTNPNTIIFGLGFPSLVPDNGKPAMLISDVDGVQLAGVMFDAGPVFSPTLLQVGEAGSTKSHAKNPTFLYDVFCRVGGVNHGSQTDTCVIINSNDVVADDFWLWRADHGSNVGWNVNKANTGLVVNGNNVTCYNLMVEHFQKYQTIWNGDNGSVTHYQSEIPYDVPNQQSWLNGSINGYASYKISNNVNTHNAIGLGIYCYFRDANNTYLDSGIEAPTGKTISLQHMIMFWLSGNQTTGIRHVVNNVGREVSPQNRQSNLATWP